MSEFKGTKGKWEYRQWDGEKWPDKRWSIGEKSTNGVCICISPRYDFESQESKANALLISKAPEMLEILKMINEEIRIMHVTQMEHFRDGIEELIKSATSVEG